MPLLRLGLGIGGGGRTVPAAGLATGSMMTGGVGAGDGVTGVGLGVGAAEGAGGLL